MLQVLEQTTHSRRRSEAEGCSQPQPRRSHSARAIAIARSQDTRGWGMPTSQRISLSSLVLISEYRLTHRGSDNISDPRSESYPADVQQRLFDDSGLRDLIPLEHTVIRKTQVARASPLGEKLLGGKQELRFRRVRPIFRRVRPILKLFDSRRVITT
jgi:hypothetical protein